MSSPAEPATSSLSKSSAALYWIGRAIYDATGTIWFSFVLSLKLLSQAYPTFVVPSLHIATTSMHQQDASERILSCYSWRYEPFYFWNFQFPCWQFEFLSVPFNTLYTNHWVSRTLGCFVTSSSWSFICADNLTPCAYFDCAGFCSWLFVQNVYDTDTSSETVCYGWLQADIPWPIFNIFSLIWSNPETHRVLCFLYSYVWCISWTWRRI